MLSAQNGECLKCGSAFGPTDTIQSTNVECAQCEKQITVCRSCKQEGCDCGGALEDAWERNPGMLF